MKHFFNKMAAKIFGGRPGGGPLGFSGGFMGDPRFAHKRAGS